MDRPKLLAMNWRDAMFAHWPVEPAVVAETLPEGVTVATHDGQAWLGVVAFVMDDIRPRGVPVGLSFGELNLRTYVRGPQGERGIYFYNLDATDPIGVSVARSLFQLPYYRASMTIERTTDGVVFASHRIHRGVPSAHFDATYRPTSDVFGPDPGSLVAFLVENYYFLTEGRSRLFRGDIAHSPWPMQEAEADIRTNDLFEANGFDDPGGEALVHYSPGVDVTATRIYEVSQTEQDSETDSQTEHAR
jgi:uncharacterized protein YqjF (DUF2071 family)